MQTYISLVHTFVEKTSLLKQAKDEADREVKQFREQKEAQFQEYSRKVWVLMLVYWRPHCDVHHKTQNIKHKT